MVQTSDAVQLRHPLRLEHALHWYTLLSCFALACSGANPAPTQPKATSSSDGATDKTAQAPPAAPAEAPAAEPDKPAEPGQDVWIEDAVNEALDNEMMPGTSGDPEPGREDALRAFFQAHPEYRTAESREPLWAHACGLDGTEAAHAFLANPPPRTPIEVEVEGHDWRVFVAHASVYCTSDDWSVYSYEASEAAKERGAITAYGNAQADAVIIRSGDRELTRIPLSGQGYIAVRAGVDPLPIAYHPFGAREAIDEYFGPVTNE